MRASVRPGGILSVNVLIEGTTFLDMFDPACYYLFGADELKEALAEWNILEDAFHDFEAPQSTLKRFATVIAHRKV